MKSINKITLSVAAMAAVALTGCKDDFMDVAPTEAVSDITIQSSVDNIYLAVNGLQKEMVSQESGYQCFGGLPGFMFCRDWMADDITCHAGGNWWSRQATWQYMQNPSSGYGTTYYWLPYQWIMNANKILESLEAIDPSSLSDSQKALYNQCKGEALAFRAFAHYELVQMYGKRYVPGQTNSQDGVIYRKSSAIEELGRSSVEEVYQNVEADFELAANLLKGIKVNDVNHFSEKVVLGFQARVALTKGEYAKAAKYAEDAIALCKLEGGKLMDESNLYCGFSNIHDDSKEVMWGAMTPDDKTVYFYSFMAYMSWNFNSSAIRSNVACVNAKLYDTMSETDLRLAWWDPTGKEKGPASNYNTFPYQNRKFKARSTSNAVCHVAFMRLAEMYLIAAEANARANQEPKAREIFAEFQVTRDPAYTMSNATGDALITEIMNSRRVELWGEGQRMFDLKRLDMDVDREDGQSDASLCGWLHRPASEWLFEIPIHETDYNPSCTKNY